MAESLNEVCPFGVRSTCLVSALECRFGNTEANAPDHCPLPQVVTLRRHSEGFDQIECAASPVGDAALRSVVESTIQKQTVWVAQLRAQAGEGVDQEAVVMRNVASVVELHNERLLAALAAQPTATALRVTDQMIRVSVTPIPVDKPMRGTATALRVTDQMIRAALDVEYPEDHGPEYAGVKLAADVGGGMMRLILEAAFAARPTDTALREALEDGVDVVRSKDGRRWRGITAMYDALDEWATRTKAALAAQPTDDAPVVGRVVKLIGQEGAE